MVNVEFELLDAFQQDSEEDDVILLETLDHEEEEEEDREEGQEEGEDTGYVSLTSQPCAATRRQAFADSRNQQQVEETSSRECTQEQGVCTAADLVIVGAGISGLYALWSILKRCPKYRSAKIIMLEQADVIGGRLRTDIISSNKTGDGDENRETFVVCEEGGMRFCYDQNKRVGEKQVMPRLIDLIKQLKLNKEIERFPMEPQGVNNQRLFYNGTSFTQWYASQNKRIWNEVFFLNPEEQDKEPGNIWKEVYRKILWENMPRLIEEVGMEGAKILLAQKDMYAARTLQTVKYWYNFRKYFTWNNTPIYKYTMKSLLTVMQYSQGCIRMLDQVGGFQCFIEGNGNAGVILQQNIMHECMKNDFWCFKNGFSILVKKLEKQIKSFLHAGAGEWNVLVNQKLVSLDLPKQDSTYSTLTVIGCQVGNTCNPGKIWKISTPKVIITVPRKSFDQIKITGRQARCPVKLMKMSNSVVDINMTKINLYFSHPWWNKKGEKLFGSSITNLPIAQVYPFYQNNMTRDGRFSDLCALTIYSDVQNSTFWSDLQSLPGLFTSEFQSEAPNQHLVPASLEVVKEALRELKLLFNVKEIPYPVLTTYTSWGQDLEESEKNPVAIHQWKRGIDDKEVRESIVQPFSDVDVYVCNEAWSDFQGWVEGSLISAHRVLDKFFYNCILE